MRIILRGLSPRGKEIIAGTDRIVGKKLTIMVYDDLRAPVLAESVPLIEPTIKRERYCNHHTKRGGIIPLFKYGYDAERGSYYYEAVQKTVIAEDAEYVFLELVEYLGGFPVEASPWTAEEMDESVKETDEMKAYTPS